MAWVAAFTAQYNDQAPNAAHRLLELLRQGPPALALQYAPYVLHKIITTPDATSEDLNTLLLTGLIPRDFALQDVRQAATIRNRDDLLTVLSKWFDTSRCQVCNTATKLTVLPCCHQACSNCVQDLAADNPANPRCRVYHDTYICDTPFDPAAVLSTVAASPSPPASPTASPTSPVLPKLTLPAQSTTIPPAALTTNTEITDRLTAVNRLVSELLTTYNSRPRNVTDVVDAAADTAHYDTLKAAIKVLQEYADALHVYQDRLTSGVTVAAQRHTLAPLTALLEAGLPPWPGGLRLPTYRPLDHHLVLAPVVWGGVPPEATLKPGLDFYPRLAARPIQRAFVNADVRRMFIRALVAGPPGNLFALYDRTIVRYTGRTSTVFRDLGSPFEIRGGVLLPTTGTAEPVLLISGYFRTYDQNMLHRNRLLRYSLAGDLLSTTGTTDSGTLALYDADHVVMLSWYRETINLVRLDGTVVRQLTVPFTESNPAGPRNSITTVGQTLVIGIHNRPVILWYDLTTNGLRITRLPAPATGVIAVATDHTSRRVIYLTHSRIGALDYDGDPIDDVLLAPALGQDIDRFMNLAAALAVMPNSDIYFEPPGSGNFFYKLPCGL